MQCNTCSASRIGIYNLTVWYVHGVIKLAFKYTSQVTLYSLHWLTIARKTLITINFF